MSFSIDRDLFEQVADSVDADYRSAYGGRGMYDSTCPAIIGSVSQVMLFILEIDNDIRDIEDLGYTSDAAIYLADNMCQDSMGYNMVFYWPGLILTD